MPATQRPAWPVRGTPGGWSDAWDGPDPVAAAHDQAERSAAERAPVADAWRAATDARAARAGQRDRSAADAVPKSPAA
jgi:hypothetical protein